MNTAVLTILALLPIITVAVFLVGLRWPASRAMPLSYIVAAGLALLVWQVPAVQVVAASINGLIVAFTLLYICLLYTSPSPRDGLLSRMPSSA